MDSQNSDIAHETGLIFGENNLQVDSTRNLWRKASQLICETTVLLFEIMTKQSSVIRRRNEVTS